MKRIRTNSAMTVVTACGLLIGGCAAEPTVAGGAGGAGGGSEQRALNGVNVKQVDSWVLCGRPSSSRAEVFDSTGSPIGTVSTSRSATSSGAKFRRVFSLWGHSVTETFTLGADGSASLRFGGIAMKWDQGQASFSREGSLSREQREMLRLGMELTSAQPRLANSCIVGTTLRDVKPIPSIIDGLRHLAKALDHAYNGLEEATEGLAETDATEGMDAPALAYALWEAYEDFEEAYEELKDGWQDLDDAANDNAAEFAECLSDEIMSGRSENEAECDCCANPNFTDEWVGTYCATVECSGSGGGMVGGGDDTACGEDDDNHNSIPDSADTGCGSLNGMKVNGDALEMLSPGSPHDGKCYTGCVVDSETFSCETYTMDGSYNCICVTSDC